MRVLFFFILYICTGTLQGWGQAGQKIKAAYQRFLADSQMKHGISSLLVADAQTGQTIFAANEHTGLAPASTLKIVTAATALEILGPRYQFVTPVLLQGTLTNGTFTGNILIKASGDPTLGSWRYAATRSFAQHTQLANALSGAGIKKWEGRFVIDEGGYGTMGNPGGWILDDIGNYYGAGCYGWNWYENQYDLLLQPGSSVGQPVKITGTQPIAEAVHLTNELTTGAAGSGDQAIIYPDGFVRGTVPAGVKSFTISGAVTEPRAYWQKSLNQWGKANGILLLERATVASPSDGPTISSTAKELTRFTSPALDSIVYFFLQKSINLYGEALAKQLAKQHGKAATTENGVQFIRNHWKNKGIDNGAIRMEDGSGLSPLNRITTHTLVQVLQHARRQSWFTSFYEGLPLINGIKMKSGSISGVRGYTGYVQSADGRTYAFAFLVNNFDGTSTAIMQKMFTVLNTLK